MAGKSRWVFACSVGLTLPVVFAAGCRKEQETAAPAPTPATAGISPDAAAKLAQADALDGEIDLVVSRCAGCALGMDGSSAHTVKVGEYSMHFCSDDCKKEFEKDTTAAILALSIPESDEPVGEDDENDDGDGSEDEDEDEGDEGK